MATNDGGGPAFPRDHYYDGHNGMTLREWFAGQCVGPLFAAAHDSFLAGNCEECPVLLEIAKDAYRLADAMLAARDAS